jgi:general nucleoside transport system ATP-binding protein
LLVAKAITKRFGRICALDGVNFFARAGEINALVGENGAGKSTLISIFAGRLRPDYGQVTLDGIPIAPGSAAGALAHGIAAVYQSAMLFERMSWEENLGLGAFNAPRFSLERVIVEAGVLADELGFALPPPGTVVERLSVAERVRLEILRTLSFRPRVLILDEPTSLLSPAELQSFLGLLLRLRNHGRVVILVTHKLAEALAVADRITVLRQGRVTAEKPAALTNEAELARLMMGEDVNLPKPKPASARNHNFAVLELNDITLKSGGRLVLDQVSLTVAAGSIVGIAGVDGNGQDELVQLMAGVRAPSSGSIVVHNGGGRSRDRLAVIPQNRDVDGMILDLSVWENLLLSRSIRMRLGSWHGWIRRSVAAQRCQELIRKFSVQVSGPNALAGSLSGGNRQRLLVARALATRPIAIIAHDICRGLDLSAAAELRARLHDYAANGGAAVLISTDLEELLALCHSLYVMNRGRLTEVRLEPHSGLIEIGLLMSGASPEPERNR